MGALEMGLTEEELQPLVYSWRESTPMITAFWWDVDAAVKTAIKQRTTIEVRGIRFTYKSGMLLIRLPSGRMLIYVKPRIGENKFGGESVTYNGALVPQRNGSELNPMVQNLWKISYRQFPETFYAMPCTIF